MKKNILLTKLTTVMLCVIVSLMLIPQQVLACTYDKWIDPPANSSCDCPGSCTIYLHSNGGYNHCMTDGSTGKQSCDPDPGTKIVFFESAPCIQSFDLLNWLACEGLLTIDATALAACLTPEETWLWDTPACKAAIAAWLGSLAGTPAICQYCSIFKCSYDATTVGYVYGHQNSASGSPCGT